MVDTLGGVRRVLQIDSAGTPVDPPTAASTGAPADAAYTDTDGSDPGTLIAIEKGLFIKLEAIRVLLAVAAIRWQYAGVTGGLIDTADVVVSAAGAAGVRNYMTGLQFHNTSATASEIVVKDGSTVIWRGVAPASMAQPAAINFDVPLRGTAATALNVAMITTGTATRVSAQGFQGS